MENQPLDRVSKRFFYLDTWSALSRPIACVIGVVGVVMLLLAGREGGIVGVLLTVVQFAIYALMVLASGDAAACLLEVDRRLQPRQDG